MLFQLWEESYKEICTPCLEVVDTVEDTVQDTVQHPGLVREL